MKTVELFIFALCVLCVSANFHHFSINETDFLHQNDRIVGGEKAKYGQFPHQVSLKKSGSHYCGGSILNKRFILTAGHCVANIVNFPKSMTAVVGLLNRFETGTTYELEKITLHPEFSINIFRGDIALLLTVKEITFTNLIKPIALPAQDTAADLVTITSGWGQTRYPGSSANLATILQYLPLNTIDLETCIVSMHVSGRDKVKDYHLCTTSVKYTGPCFGDSGGPLIYESKPNDKVLVGVVSWGIGCAQGYPHVFTRVFSHIIWLQNEMNKQVPGISN